MCRSVGTKSRSRKGSEQRQGRSVSFTQFVYLEYNM
jgi:hypothetical protein